MPAFALQVNNRPVLLSLLNVTESKFTLRGPKATGEKNRQGGAVTLALQQLRVWRIAEPLQLFGRQPIPKPDADLLNPLDAPYAGGQVGA